MRSNSSGDGIEVKFNPNHDPVTGRSTFKIGAWQGGGFTGGGGGSGGGGGASGDWGSPTQSPSRRNASQAALPKVLRSATSPQAAAAAPKVPAPPWHTVERNGYDYQIDATDRTRQVTGTLSPSPTQSRSRSSQADAGGSDRLPTDDGGHYVAARFNGPTDAFNHFAQDANFNHGCYRVLENQWANDTKEGKQVYVKITPEYSGSSKRPDNLSVFFSVNGRPEIQTFPNT